MRGFTVTVRHLRNIGVAVALIVFFGLLVSSLHNAQEASRRAEANSRAIRELNRDVQFAACEQLRVVRKVANTLASVMWLTLRSAQKRELALTRTTSGGYSVHIANAKAAGHLADRLPYQPDVDCRLATLAPGVYKPPAPLPFEAAPLRLRT